MKKDKIIIVEGPRGAGKTTITNWLREQIPYTNLYRLAGSSNNETVKSTAVMYSSLIGYLRSMVGCDMTLLFDRVFITEYVYCQLGYKHYDFERQFKNLMTALEDLTMYYDVYILNLEVSDRKVYTERLSGRGWKANYYDLEYTASVSLIQEDMYCTVMSRIREKFPKIKVVNIDTTVVGYKENIMSHLGLEENTK